MNHSLPGSSAHGSHDSPGKNIGVGCQALHQRIFLSQGLNLCLLCLTLAGGFFTISTTWGASSSRDIFSSVQFIHSVMSDSLWPHELQHARPPCPSPTSGVHSDSRPLSQWCHPAISFLVVPFSSCPQSLPASESFPMSQLFTWSGKSTEVSALAPFLPKKSKGWSPLEWTGWISLQSKGLSRVFSNTTIKPKQKWERKRPTSTSLSLGM